MALRPNCDEDTRVRKQLAALLNPDLPIIDHIHVVAGAVAATCGSLTLDQQRSCAARLFDVSAQCALADTFVAIYQAQRDYLAGRLDSRKVIAKA